MRTPQSYRRQQKSVVFVGLLLFELLLFFLQIWLFVMVLENLLGGKSQMAVPAAASSLALFAVNLWMLRGVQKLTKAS